MQYDLSYFSLEVIAKVIVRGQHLTTFINHTLFYIFQKITIMNYIL